MDTGTAGSAATPGQTIGEALDEAPLSLFHLKAAVTSAMGFFTDAYDLFIIGVAITLVKSEWHLSAVQTSFLGSATLIATLIGAVVCGRLADVFGRKSVYGVVAMIMAGGAIATALAPSYIWLVVFRFVLGIGIGGDYPVSAVLISEYANKARRGLLVSLVFSAQAAGLVMGPVVALCLLASGVNHDIAWRVMLGLGALPALSVIYLRRSMPESPRFAAAVQGREDEARASLARYSQGVVHSAAGPTQRVHSSLRSFLTTRRSLRLILGTAGSWFLLDYVYYGNTISAPQVLRAVAPSTDLLHTTAWTLIIFSLFAVPGYVLAFLRIDHIGHRRLQWIGFLGMAACFACIGLVPGLTKAVVPFLLLYGVSYFFTEFGPNVTTFVIPTEVFGVGERSTGHGIAAGVGKLGAFIGVFVFPLEAAAFGLGGTLLLCAVLGLAGALLTQILPEPGGLSLDALAGSSASGQVAPRPAASVLVASEALNGEHAAKELVTDPVA